MVFANQILTSGFRHILQKTPQFTPKNKHYVPGISLEEALPIFIEGRGGERRKAAAGYFNGMRGGGGISRWERRRTDLKRSTDGTAAPCGTPYPIGRSQRTQKNMSEIGTQKRGIFANRDICQESGLIIV